MEMQIDRRRALIFLLAGIVIGASAEHITTALIEWQIEHPASAEGARSSLSEPSRRSGKTESSTAKAIAARTAAELVISGGSILYFRHGNREKWDSVIAFDVYEMATGADASSASYRNAVCLSPQGREEGKIIGEIFRLAGVKVSRVMSSPSCRARETAKLAFGRIDEILPALAHTPVANTVNANAFADSLRAALINAPIESGQNIVITAHGNTLENHAEIFVSGAELLSAPALMETGFYVLRRTPDNKLQIVHKFLTLGDFAAAAVTLNPEPDQ